MPSLAAGCASAQAAAGIFSPDLVSDPREETVVPLMASEHHFGVLMRPKPQQQSVSRSLRPVVAKNWRVTKRDPVEQREV